MDPHVLRVEHEEHNGHTPDWHPQYLHAIALIKAIIILDLTLSL